MTSARTRADSVVKPQDRVPKDALAWLDTEQGWPVNQELSVPQSHRAISTNPCRYRTYALRMMDTVSCKRSKHDMLNIPIYSTALCLSCAVCVTLLFVP